MTNDPKTGAAGTTTRRRDELSQTQTFWRAVAMGVVYVAISGIAALVGGSGLIGGDADWPAFWFTQILIYAVLSCVIVFVSQMIDNRATDRGLGGPAVFLMALGTLVSYAAFVVNEVKQIQSGQDHNIVRVDVAAVVRGLTDLFGHEYIPTRDGYLVFYGVLLLIYAGAAAIVVTSLLADNESNLLRKLNSFFRKVNTRGQQDEFGRSIETLGQESERLSALSARLKDSQAREALHSRRHVFYTRQSGEFGAIASHTRYKSGLVEEDAPTVEDAGVATPFFDGLIGQLAEGMGEFDRRAAIEGAAASEEARLRAEWVSQSGLPDQAAIEARLEVIDRQLRGLEGGLSAARAQDGLMVFDRTPEREEIHDVASLLGVGMMVTVLLMALNNYLLAPELKEGVGGNRGLLTSLGLLGLFLLQGVAAYDGLTQARLYVIRQQIARRGLLHTDEPSVLSRLLALLLLVATGFGLYLSMKLSEPTQARPLALAELSCRAFAPEDDDKPGQASAQTPVQGAWRFNSDTAFDVASCRLAKPLDHQTYIVVVGTASQEGDPAEQANLANERAYHLAAQLRAEQGEAKVPVFVVNLGRAKEAELDPAAGNDHGQQTRPQRPVIVLTGNLMPASLPLSARIKALFVKPEAEKPGLGDIWGRLDEALTTVPGFDRTAYEPQWCRAYEVAGAPAAEPDVCPPPFGAIEAPTPQEHTPQESMSQESGQ